MKSNLVKAAIVVSTIVALGAPAAFALQINKNANVSVGASTTVFSTVTSFAVTSTNTTQVGGGAFSNQKSTTNTSTTSSATSFLDASAGNVVVISQ